MVRLFGTNGIRWVVGDRPPDFPARLGLAAGVFYGEGACLAIGHDTRTSSDIVLGAAASGLMSAGCSLIRLGIVPTPAVQFAVRELGLGGGAMVTASHNPPEFNGLKFFARDGTELPRADEVRMEELVADSNLRSAAWDRVGTMRSDHKVQAGYRQRIIELTRPGKAKVMAVVDCANGTAAEFSPDVLSKCGWSVSTINSRHDGTFPGRMPEPVKENLGGLMSAVKSHGADLGIAHDGDADRATFVDEKGAFVTGDQSLALFAADAVQRNGGGTVVIPITASRMVEEAVISAGGAIEYTAVGSPIIARRMMENRAVLGGEGNGGTIFPEHQFCRDGIMAAARMAEMVSRGTPLSDLVAGLPRYHTVSGKLRMSPDSRDGILREVRKRAGGDIVEIDGVKSTYDDHWILIRASGTEPIIRITVESRDAAKSERILAEQLKALQDIIRGLSS